MAWQGVHISQPGRLSFKDNQLRVEQDDGVVTMPLEDLAWIMLESPRATMTSVLMAACADAGIAVITCDERHHPNGCLLPFHAHHRQSDIARQQIAITQPFRKRSWQMLVRQKILNQAAVLNHFGVADAASALAGMAERIASGDPDNIEARAAREYWSALFSDFRRGDGRDGRNRMLDYGYAILRATIARALVARGLLPAFGLFHASITNPFNLADDVIEPFRPLVDYQVAHIAGRSEKISDDRPDITERRQMATILQQNIRIAHETMTALAATEAVANSLGRAIETGKPAEIILPVPAF